MMSTAGRCGPGSGSLRLTHQSSHSGANMKMNSTLTAYSGRNTCSTEPRLACSEMYAYPAISTVTTVTSAQQVSRVSHSRGRRTLGSVVARGRTNVVKVRRITTSPPMSRLARVASMPNGATSQPEAMPIAIISAWVRMDIARYSRPWPRTARRRPRFVRSTTAVPAMYATPKNTRAGRSRAM